MSGWLPDLAPNLPRELADRVGGHVPVEKLDAILKGCWAYMPSERVSMAEVSSVLTVLRRIRPLY